MFEAFRDAPAVEIWTTTSKKESHSPSTLSGKETHKQTRTRWKKATWTWTFLLFCSLKVSYDGEALNTSLLHVADEPLTEKSAVAPIWDSCGPTRGSADVYPASPETPQNAWTNQWKASCQTQLGCCSELLYLWPTFYKQNNSKYWLHDSSFFRKNILRGFCARILPAGVLCTNEDLRGKTQGKWHLRKLCYHFFLLV